MKLNNKGKGVAYATLSILLYSIPLIILGVIKREDLFTTAETSLTSLSVTMLIFFVVFAKKVVKGFCKALTPLGFGSLIVLLVSLGLKAFLDDLSLIATASLVGSILAWYPYQIAQVFSANNLDANGNEKAPLSFKQANAKLFSISLTEK